MYGFRGESPKTKSRFRRLMAPHHWRLTPASGQPIAVDGDLTEICRIGGPGLNGSDAAATSRYFLRDLAPMGRAKSHKSHDGEFLMARIRFGTFLAPHHPVGEHPTL